MTTAKKSSILSSSLLSISILQNIQIRLVKNTATLNFVT